MFHPDLTYDIVRMRNEELIAAASSHRGTRARPQRSWARWFRRSAEPVVVAAAPAPEALSRHLRAVPPPRHERTPTGHDDSRVA